jgi:hypothetical protein
LNKPVDFLCWPCGDYTPRLQRIAVEECGYLATVNVNKTSNRQGADSDRVESNCLWTGLFWPLAGVAALHELLLGT